MFTRVPRLSQFPGIPCLCLCSLSCNESSPKRKSLQCVRCNSLQSLMFIFSESSIFSSSPGSSFNKLLIHFPLSAAQHFICFFQKLQVSYANEGDNLSFEITLCLRSYVNMQKMQLWNVEGNVYFQTPHLKGE